MDISPPVSVMEFNDVTEGVLEGGWKLMDVNEPVAEADGGLFVNVDEGENEIAGGPLIDVQDPDIQVDV